MNVVETIKQFAGETALVDIVICFAGMSIFSYWLLNSSLGRKSLAGSRPRLNIMPVYLPFIPLFIWFGTVAIASTIAKRFLPDLPDWRQGYLDNLIFTFSGLLTVGIIISLARVYFVERIKGFGLDWRTIVKDFVAAVVNLFAVWPLLIAAIVLTTRFGQLIWPEFEMKQHQELEMMSQYSNLPLRISVIAVAVMVAPVLEEMLFRGLFQTMLRSFLPGPWLCIAASSALFAIVHGNPSHWPALFVLAMCMGYSYEKSGSLLRPIFIHSLFNAATIAAAMSQ